MVLDSSDIAVRTNLEAIAEAIFGKVVVRRAAAAVCNSAFAHPAN